LLDLGKLDQTVDEPWTEGGPVGSACAMVAGAWFLTREVELSTARACLVALEVSATAEKVVRWSLPASKTDTEAHGVARAHGCCCTADSLVGACPFHAVKAQLERLRRLFPDRWSASGPDEDLPLFPAKDGSVVAKDRMAATIVEAARKLEVPLSLPDGSARVSGHSLRVAGAQGLARAGVDVWAIQLLGRWGSSAVLGYVREVPLEHAASWASRAVRSCSLEELLRSRASAPTSSSSSPSSSLVSPAPSAPPALGQPVGLDEAVTEAELAAVVEARPASECKYVSSPALCTTRVAKWHRVSHTGLSGAVAGWTSACGWRFSGSSACLSNELPENLCHKHFCGKCFPEHRAALKERSR
jgi:hypothetical protein